MMRDGTMHVELKSLYGFCAFENGRTLASHNFMSFYMGDITRFNVPKKGCMYPDNFLEQLALEVKQNWFKEEEMKRLNIYNYTWKGECKFSFPKKSPSQNNLLLTPVSTSHCYVDEIYPNEWFQMKSKNGHGSYCDESSKLSLDFNVQLTNCGNVCALNL